MASGPHSTILSPADSAKVTAAVGAAEAHANAEIVTVVTRASDAYADVALGWSALIAGLTLLVVTLFSGFTLSLADALLGLWAHAWTPHEVLEFALFVACIAFIGMWVILQWRRLRLIVTPGPIKAARVRARAQIAFRLAAQGRTQGATGVVIYLSMAERRAEIVADAAIAGKVEPQVWGDAMHAMLAHFRDDRVGDGLVEGVTQVGRVLAAHFPREHQPVNELPDGPIEL
jgi:putative membrane protein